MCCVQQHASGFLFVFLLVVCLFVLAEYEWNTIVQNHKILSLYIHNHWLRHQSWPNMSALSSPISLKAVFIPPWGLGSLVRVTYPILSTLVNYLMVFYMYRERKQSPHFVCVCVCGWAGRAFLLPPGLLRSCSSSPRHLGIYTLALNTPASPRLSVCVVTLKNQVPPIAAWVLSLFAVSLDPD